MSSNESLTNSSVILNFPETVPRPTLEQGCPIWATEPHLDITADFSGADVAYRGYFFQITYFNFNIFCFHGSNKAGIVFSVLVTCFEVS